MLQLVEAWQKHADVLDSLRGAEEEAKRLRAEFSKSEALRTKLALGVQQAQASRCASPESALLLHPWKGAGGPAGPSTWNGTIVETCIVTQEKPPLKAVKKLQLSVYSSVFSSPV